MSEALVERLNAAEIALRDDRPYAAVAIGEAADRIEAIEADKARLSEALRQVRHAIMIADPAVLTDTFWMPDNVFKGGTVVDFIDAALSGSGSGWRAMDSAPKDGTQVLIRTPQGVLSCEWDEDAQEWLAGWVGVGLHHKEALGWQSLPAAPQQGGE